MNHQETAKLIAEVANKRGGNIMVGDVDQAVIDFGLEMGWLEPVGIGHFQITESARQAAK